MHAFGLNNYNEARAVDALDEVALKKGSREKAKGIIADIKLLFDKDFYDHHRRPSTMKGKGGGGGGAQGSRKRKGGR